MVEEKKQASGANPNPLIHGRKSETRLSKVLGGVPARKPAQPVEELEPREVKQITIQIPSIQLSFDKNFRQRLPFYALMVLLFVFSLVLFQKANFHTSDIVDFARIQYNIPKLWSISFFLFLLLFSFALALAIYFGFNQNWGAVLILVAPVTIIPAIVVGLFFSVPYLLAFLSMALTLVAGAVVASMRSECKVSSVWGCAGTALIVFVLCAFLVSYYNVSSQKDVYMDTFVSSGVSTSISQLQGSNPTLSISAGTVSSAVTRKQFEDLITIDRVKEMLSTMPGWDSMSQGKQLEAADAVRVKVIDNLYANAGEDVSTLLSNVQLDVGNQQGGLGGDVKSVLGQTPAFVVFYNNFALLSSLLVAAVVSFFGFFVKAIATALVWLLTKL